MRKFYFSLLTTMLMSTLALASFEDDGFNHVTKAGKIVQAWTPEVKQSSMAIGHVWYDPSKTNGQQLSFRVLQNDTQYICPPIPGVKGLESARNMGISPQYKALFDGALVELLDPKTPVTAVGKTFPISAGLYRILRVNKLPGNPEIISDMKRTKYELECQSSSARAIIQFYETTFNAPPGLNIRGVSDWPIVAEPKASDIYTFSCWYCPDAAGRTGATLPIFTATYPTSEKGLEGKFKTFVLGILNQKTKKDGHYQSNITFAYPVVKAGKPRPIKIKQTIEVNETKPKVIPAVTKSEKVKWTALTKKQWVVFLDKGRVGLPAGYSVPSLNPQQMQLFNITQRRIRAILPQWRELQYWLTEGCMNNCCPLMKTTVVTPAKTIQEPTGKKIKVTKEVDSTEPTFVMEQGLGSSNHLVSDDWLHIMLVVNAKAKAATAYCNGESVWTIKSPELLSLKAKGTMKFGPHAAELAEAYVVDGSHLPQEFGCFNCQNQWVPKKFVGSLGVNGFSPQGKKSPNK